MREENYEIKKGQQKENKPKTWEFLEVRWLSSPRHSEMNGDAKGKEQNQPQKQGNARVKH